MKPEETKNKSGYWTDGFYSIEWIGRDRVKVIRRWASYDEHVTLHGGSFQAILDTLFVDAELRRVSHNETQNAQDQV